MTGTATADAKAVRITSFEDPPTLGLSWRRGSWKGRQTANPFSDDRECRNLCRSRGRNRQRSMVHRSRGTFREHSENQR